MPEYILTYDAKGEKTSVHPKELDNGAIDRTARILGYKTKEEFLFVLNNGKSKD